MPKGRPLTSSRPSTEYGRFALFIDGANLYHTLRELGLHIDYRRLLVALEMRGTLLRATYYTAILAENPPDWLVRLTDWLAYNGYHVVTRPARRFRQRTLDEDGIESWIEETKGNVNIELVVDMLKLAPYCDTMLLFTGNGDFVSVIEALQRQGCRVIVVSSEKTESSVVADVLRREADEFVELMTLADEVGMRE